MTARRAQARAFTLLEVLVAVAILGLGLTIILSSQAGLFSSASRGQHMTVAGNLLRCKMSEVQLELMQKGFPLADENDEGDCCDEGEEGYSCSWKVERVELPNLPMDGDLDAGLSLDGGLDFATPGTTPLPGSSAAAAAPGPLGPLGALTQIQATQGASLGENPTPGSVMEQLGGDPAAMNGMAGMVMGLVYPGLKPLLEASIRRVTVTVRWREGENERDLAATLFVTRPQEGELPTEAGDAGLGDLGNLLNQGALGGSSTPNEDRRGGAK